MRNSKRNACCSHDISNEAGYDVGYFSMPVLDALID